MQLVLGTETQMTWEHIIVMSTTHLRFLADDTHGDVSRTGIPCYSLQTRTKHCRHMLTFQAGLSTGKTGYVHTYSSSVHICTQVLATDIQCVNQYDDGSQYWSSCVGILSQFSTKETILHVSSHIVFIMKLSSVSIIYRQQTHALQDDSSNLATAALL